MEIIDGQRHEPAALLDWSEADVEARRRVMSELLLGTMDAVGVDGALLHPIEDEAWAEELAAQYPGRFASIVMYRDFDAPDLPQRIASLRERPGVLGVRLSMGVDPTAGLKILQSGVVEPALVAAEEHDFPLFLVVSGHADAVAPIAASHPNLTVVIDHLGLRQPASQPRDNPPFARLPALLELAQFDNVWVKVCGVPSLSEEPFPYRDVWPSVHQIIDAFGIERLFWASDIDRFYGRVGWEYRVPAAQVDYSGKHTYGESLGLFRDTDEISEHDKELLLGANLRRLLRWQAG